jgi:tetratricopeptide (TPR) repeat protein
MALLEQMVLKVERAGDVPGWMIPSLYVQFLHSGDSDLVEPVFAHNAHDILSLVALHGIAGDILAHPERVPVTVDWFGLGLLLNARGRTETAAECYRRALDDERDPGVRRHTVTALARHYRRTGLVDPLLTLWADEVERGVLSRWLALERLAMVWEWELRDPARALAYTDQALAAVSGALPVFEQRLMHRRERLRRKLAADPIRTPRRHTPVTERIVSQPEQEISITQSVEIGRRTCGPSRRNGEEGMAVAIELPPVLE